MQWLGARVFDPYAHRSAKVVIGIGENNVVRGGDKVKVKVKFKAKQSELEIKIDAKFRLSFGGGDHELVVPTVPITVTAPLSPTTPTSATIIIQRLPVERIDARFTGVWRGRGGLAIFGLPLTDAIVLPSGITVQYFERARLEYHPELAGTQYEVLIGLLGVELGYATPPVAAPATATELRWYFPATGHLLAREFRSYWQARGGLLLFGYPIGEVVTENGRQVQYFERARLELHPELAGTPYEVQLGHLGVLVLEREGDD